jgi:hypothetical protein
VDEDAVALSRALVVSLSKLHVAAQALPPKDPVPQSGWLVRGVFCSLDDGGHLLTIPLLSSRKTQNVEVTVTLTDSAKDPSAPFASIGADSALKGQRAPIGWNPYVVSARFVVHRIEGDKSIRALADQIAQTIVDRATELSNQDAARP